MSTTAQDYLESAFACIHSGRYEDAAAEITEALSLISSFDEAYLLDRGFKKGPNGQVTLKLRSGFVLIAYETQNWSLHIENNPHGYYGCEHDLEIARPKNRRELSRLLAILNPTT